MLLVWLEPPHWCRLDGDRITASGDGLPPADAAVPLIAIVPGASVALHWLELPELAPAQALAAARMLAGELTGAPGTGHVALGPRDGAGRQLLAIVAHDRMASWLATLANAGHTPARLVPEPLLVPQPAAGVGVLTRDNEWLVHGPDIAFAAEPELARLLIGARPTAMVDRLDLALATTALDLRQADYALVQRWRPPAGALRRLAPLAAGIAAALVGAIVAELPTGAQAGLGARLLTGSYYGNTVQIWSALVMAALLGLALTGAVAWAEKLLTPGGRK